MCEVCFYWPCIGPCYCMCNGESYSDMLIFHTTVIHDKTLKAVVGTQIFFFYAFLHLSSFFPFITLDTSRTLNNYCPHYPNMEVHSVSHKYTLIKLIISNHFCTDTHSRPEMWWRICLQCSCSDHLCNITFP